MEFIISQWKISIYLAIVFFSSSYCDDYTNKTISLLPLSPLKPSEQENKMFQKYENKCTVDPYPKHYVIYIFRGCAFDYDIWNSIRGVEICNIIKKHATNRNECQTNIILSLQEYQNVLNNYNILKEHYSNKKYKFILKNILPKWNTYTCYDYFHNDKSYVYANLQYALKNYVEIHQLHDQSYVYQVTQKLDYMFQCQGHWFVDLIWTNPICGESMETYNLRVLNQGFMPLDIDYINKYYNYEESNCKIYAVSSSYLNHNNLAYASDELFIPYLSLYVPEEKYNR